MGLETIVGIAALIMAAIAGAFGIGHSRGTSKAEAKADKQRTDEKAAATEAVAERRVTIRLRSLCSTARYLFATR